MIAVEQIIPKNESLDERVDTRTALRTLQVAFPPERPPEGYVVGRTQMRNALADKTGCSLLRAEDLIMELIQRGLVHYDGHPNQLETAPTYWSIEQ